MRLRGFVVALVVVAAGAAGFVIVGGKIKKVPPRGPAFAKLAGAVAEIAGRSAGGR